MNYKETLFFIAKCLTISLEDKNKQEIEKQLKSTSIDWDAVVKVSTAHYVFPALYCNLKRVDFLKYLPQELVSYMEHITDLNRERNKKIITQAKELNSLLLDNKITPIFLKGTGNLLAGIYGDIAERMVGDIDFIFSKEDYPKAIEILENEKYSTDKEFVKFYRHYPRLTNTSKIAAIEIHNNVLNKPYSAILSFEKINKDAELFSNIKVASYGDKLLNSILPKQINDNLYYSKTICLRTVYDVFLLFKKSNGFIPKTNNQKVDKRFNNFIGCVNFLLKIKDLNNFKETNSSKKYLYNYISVLNKSKKEELKIEVLNIFVKFNLYLNILLWSFTSREYREYSLNSLTSIAFYKRKLGVK
ncbi:nucleotidyltransferase family protein [Polaribacter sp.]|nr:nucleotidyltransferase family protein [Polaribacter sp.]